MNETVMGIWTSLVRLSGTSGQAAAAMVALPLSGASNITALTPTKPIQRTSKLSSDGKHDNT